MLKTSWVSRQKVEMDRRMKKSEPKATYCRDRDTDRERGEFAQSYHSESTRICNICGTTVCSLMPSLRDGRKDDE